MIWSISQALYNYFTLKNNIKNIGCLLSSCSPDIDQMCFLIDIQMGHAFLKTALMQLKNIEINADIFKKNWSAVYLTLWDIWQ